jgi:hypothetical protein
LASRKSNQSQSCYGARHQAPTFLTHQFHIWQTAVMHK